MVNGIDPRLLARAQALQSFPRPQQSFPQTQTPIPQGSINQIAQQIQQGQTSAGAFRGGQQVAPLQQQQAQALLTPQQAPEQETITTAAELLQGSNVGLSLAAKNLLEFSSDRSRNPLARGLAAFIGTKTLREEGEKSAEAERAATKAEAEQAKFERGITEREIAVKEAAEARQAGKKKEFKGPQTETASFANRLVNTTSRLAKLEGAGVSTTGFAANVLQSADEQVFLREKRDFITAILRKESGAAIGEDEFDKEDEKFFPQLGDGDKVLKAKARARMDAAKGLVKESQGAFEGLFPESAEVLAGFEQPVEEADQRANVVVGDAIVDGSINFASPKVQQAFDKGFTQEQIMEFLK